MKRKIVLATRNEGKVRELNALLAGSGIEAVGLANFPDIGEVEENGSTFEENALLKAREIAKLTGLPCLADDSGISADALGGGPGVFSARYGDDWDKIKGETRDQRNTRKLLSETRDAGERGCRYITVMAAALPDGEAITTRGEWAGSLLREPRGTNGFGYDPVFLDPELNKTAAELSPREKNERSHRGKATRAMLEKLPAFLARAEKT